MKALSKVTISALLIVYSFVGFAILSPLVSAFTKNPIFLTVGLSFSLFFVLTTFITSRFVDAQWKGIFSRAEEEEETKIWLLLHSLFTFTSGDVYIYTALFSSFAPLLSPNHASFFPMTFMAAWMILLLSTIGLWALHLIIGMGYRWFCRGTTLGIRSFSAVALQHLRNKDYKGMEYLLKAFLLFKDCLKHEELELQELNNAIRTTRCFLHFQTKIPFDNLQKLALELKEYPSIERLPKTLSTFNRSKQVQWTGKFTTIERKKRTILELVVIVAVVLSGLTFFPETARSTLLEILQSVGSVENMQIIMGFFLVFVTVYISSLIRPYALNPFEAKKLSDVS